MTRIAIGLQIAELDAHIRDLQTQAARRGSGQANAQLRLDAARSARTTLAWCRDNQDTIRQWAASKRLATVEASDTGE